MSEMKPEYKKLLACPHCGSRRFYVEQGGALNFLSLDRDGRVADYKTPEPPSITKDTPIYCTGCSWEGSLAELLAANKAGSE